MSPGQNRSGTLVKHLGLGRLLYLGFHYPLAALTKSRREGGPFHQWRDAQGRGEMKQAASRLPTLPSPPATSPEVHFLTGRKFWYQTAFCFWSLQRHAGIGLRLVLIDDGTIDSEVRSACERLFPGSRIVSAAECEERLNRLLPFSRYPTLRAQRQSYVHLRKLTDVHLGGPGWKLVLDSDMLFFREPTQLLDWLKAPTAPLHMMDIQNAYGYPDETLSLLAGQPIPPRINVGVLGLRSESIDWEKLEQWCSHLLSLYGTSYYLEQALCALLLSADSPIKLPAKDYLLMPDETECREPQACLHHYVAESKRGYFRHAWRHLT